MFSLITKLIPYFEKSAMSNKTKDVNPWIYNLFLEYRQFSQNHSKYVLLILCLLFETPHILLLGSGKQQGTAWKKDHLIMSLLILIVNKYFNPILLVSAEEFWTWSNWATMFLENDVICFIATTNCSFATFFLVIQSWTQYLWIY